jgi:hypothetical protein
MISVVLAVSHQFSFDVRRCLLVVGWILVTAVITLVDEELLYTCLQ